MVTGIKYAGSAGVAQKSRTMLPDASLHAYLMASRGVAKGAGVRCAGVPRQANRYVRVWRRASARREMPPDS